MLLQKQHEADSYAAGDAACLTQPHALQQDVHLAFIICDIMLMSHETGLMQQDTACSQYATGAAALAAGRHLHTS